MAQLSERLASRTTIGARQRIRWTTIAHSATRVKHDGLTRMTMRQITREDTFEAANPRNNVLEMVTRLELVDLLKWTTGATVVTNLLRRIAGAAGLTRLVDAD